MPYAPHPKGDKVPYMEVPGLTLAQVKYTHLLSKETEVMLFKYTTNNFAIYERAVVTYLADKHQTTAKHIRQVYEFEVDCVGNYVIP